MGWGVDGRRYSAFCNHAVQRDSPPILIVELAEFVLASTPEI